MREACLVLIFGLPLAFAAPGSAASYYAADAGDDANSGTSSASPWKTLAKINSFAFSPGDTIYLKAGDLWRETLAPASSGRIGSPLVFTQYGAGPAPVISGSDLVAGWTLHSGSIYRATLAAAPSNVYVDGGSGAGNALGRETQWGLTSANCVSGCGAGAYTSIGAMTAGSWYYSSGTLYVWLADSSDPGVHSVEAAVRVDGIHIDGWSGANNGVSGVSFPQTCGTSGGCSTPVTGLRSVITIDGLQVQRTAGWGIRMEMSPYAVVKNSTVTQTGTGLSPDNNRYYNGLYVNHGYQGLYQNNVVSYCGGHGNPINIQEDDDSRILGNDASHGNHTGGIDHKNQTGTLIAGNFAHDTDGHIGIYGEYVVNDLIEQNIVANTYNAAMVSGQDSGIQLDVNSLTPTIYNNTLYNVGAGIYLVTGVVPTIKNNIVVNAHRGVLEQLTTGGTADYNDWGVSPTFYLGAGETAYGFSQWQALGGRSHDLAVDPLWAAPGAEDFGLTSGSPAIATGVNVGLPYSGAAPDLGAVAFTATTRAAISGLIPSGPIVISGQNGTVIKNLKITSATGNCMTISNSTNVVIEGSEIGPCGAASGAGVSIVGGSNIGVYDNYIHAEHRAVSCCDTGDGVYASGVSSLTIRGNVIAYNESNIEVGAATGVSVIGNFLLNPRGDFPRGQNFQSWNNSGGILVQNNYALSSTDTTKYLYPENQEDSINFGISNGIVAQGNYVRGGHSASGCGIIADDAANNVQFRNNTLVDTGQCGIGIGDGINGVVDGNRVLNRTPVAGGGNTAIYVWKQYANPCGPTQVTANVGYETKTDGTFSGYWNGGGCDPTTTSGNTWDAAAQTLLEPIDAKYPAPAIPPQPNACVAPSPYSNQTGWPSCAASTAAAVDATPPVAAITAPANGSKVFGAVSVGVNASDNVGVTQVQLYFNSTLVATDIAAPYAFNWNTKAVPNGTYQLKAVAYDAAGNTAVSTITVSIGNKHIKSTLTLASNAFSSAGITTLGAQPSQTQFAISVDTAGEPSFPLSATLQAGVAFPSGYKSLTLSQLSSDPTVFFAKVPDATFAAADFAVIDGDSLTISIGTMTFDALGEAGLVEPALGGLIAESSGPALVLIAPGQITQEARITINPEPADVSGARAAALAKQNLGSLGAGRDIVMISSGSLSGATILLPYDPTKISTGQDASQAHIAYYNFNTGAWELAGNVIVDPVGHALQAQVTHFSLYAPVIPAAISGPALIAAYAYPNPAASGQTPTVRACLGQVDGVEITIFDQSGRVVQNASLNGASPAVAANGPCIGQFFYDYPWTGRIASGVYFAAIRGKVGGSVAVKARVKFAVVR